ncbi:MAG: hypothetical protein ABIO55_15220 [Ginsengibacter sp.]
MKKISCYFLIPILCFCNKEISAQNITDTTKPRIYKIAVFAPLYLDSVFTDNKLRSDRSIPKLVIPALEFVQGAQIAFDSLTLDNHKVEAFIYDTKSFTEPLSQLLQGNKLNNVNLIIGSVRDTDLRELADFSLSKNIPFISATFPNDGGITGNPFLVIMNSTLKGHCEGIYSYILQNHGTDKIYLFKKPGAQEDKIATLFKTLNEQEGKPLLNIQTITFDSSFSEFAFRKKLDSNRNSIIIGGSLNESFAKNLSNVCYASRESYPLTLIGMPNWDGFKFFKDDSYKDFPVYFTIPYYNPKTNSLSTMLEDEYNSRFKTIPGDLVYRGFESAWYFTKLLTRYPDDLMLHLNDKSLKIINDYNFRPVLLKDETLPDYFENKHLYVMRIMNGKVSREF